MLERVAIVGPLAYLALFAFIRMVGKRTLSNMNALDFVVTVAIGSTIPAIILSNVSLGIAALALAIPLFLQVGVVWITSRSETAERLVKSRPALLLYDGKLLTDMMKHEMITEEEVREALRKAGLPSMHDAKAVVLEVDGNLSVLPRGKRVPNDESSTLHEVLKDAHSAD
jgi:uncharacterized membrane protein YcaP (DUF421 family)